MLARIQQAIALTLATLAVACVGLAVSGRGLASSLVIAVVILGYAGALGLEFFWLVRSYDESDLIHPSLRQVLFAWSRELRAAPLVFLWRQPFRSQSQPDHVTTNRRVRGVVLIHGFFCNRGIWNSWMARLRARDIPFVAVNLEPLFGSIDTYTPLVDAAVRRVEQATGRAPIVVAHSMGGLAARAWAAQAGNAARAARVVTIATPHRGTWLARHSHAVNGREMRIASPWLTSLFAREGSAMPGRCICFWSQCDNIVIPTIHATLPGADNRHLVATPHVHMVEHPEIWAAVLAETESAAG